MDLPYDSYQNSSEDLPKDLTVKTAKKLKPIPPPLNLGQDEVAKISSTTHTSPKSPLVQKHLPFRKRAHSISANLNKQDSSITIPPTLEENIASEFSPTTLERVQSSPSIKLESECCFRQNSEIYFTSNTDTTASYPNYRVGQYVKEEYRIPVDKERDKEIVYTSSNINSGSYRSQIEQISNNDLKQDGFVLDLSTNHNSVLLSPAPSSLGSSREELADAAKHTSKFISWGCPWPPPIWHCFQPGSKLKLGGCWRTVEELSSYPPDWPGELLVERLSLPRDNSLQITFCALSSCGEIIADVSSSHAFLVKDRGWAAVCSDDLYKRYAVKCSPLQPGDIVVQPVSHTLPMPSPDICDRMKRFSFPTSEESPSTAFLLSPPTTPTRKTQDTSDKPKRPMNAFMLFAKRYRLELIQTNPGKDNRAISVILGEAWRTLPQEERDIFIQGAKDLSEEQKALYPDCWKRKRSHSTS